MTCCKWGRKQSQYQIFGKQKLQLASPAFNLVLISLGSPTDVSLASSIPYITKVHSYDVINIVNISFHLFQGPRMPYITKRSRGGCLSSDLLQLFLILKIVKEFKHLLFLMITQEHLKRASMICRKRLESHDDFS